MHKIKIAICEDDKKQQAKIRAILDKSHIPLTYTIFDCGEDILESYTIDKYDLLLMDIYMVGITGVDTVRKIRTIDQDVFIAFITTSPDHALEGYHLNVNKYLLKPLKKQDVFALLEFVQIQKQNIPQLIIKINGKDVSLPFADIMYLEQNANSLFIFLNNGAPVRARYKLDELESQFDPKVFFRSHTSFIVNLTWVKRINREMMVFEMKNGSRAYIRRTDMGKAKKAFHAYGISKQIAMG